MKVLIFLAMLMLPLSAHAGRYKNWDGRGFSNSGTQQAVQYQRVGNQVHGSNGVYYQKVGNEIHGSDGTQCRTVGNSVICDQNDALRVNKRFRNKPLSETF